MTKLSGVRHGKREFEAYSLALSLAHRTRAQPDSRQAAAVVCWRSSRSNPAAASCELAPSMFTHVISPSMASRYASLTTFSGSRMWSPNLNRASTRSPPDANLASFAHLRKTPS